MAEELNEISEKIEDLEPLKKEIERTAAKLESRTLKKRGLWQNEKRFFDKINNIMEEEKKIINERIITTFIPKLPEVEEKSPNILKVEEVTKIIEQFYLEIKDCRENELDLLERCKERTNLIYFSWYENFEKEEKRFREELIKFDETSLEAISNRLTEMKEKEFIIESEIIPEKERISNLLNKEDKEREKLLKELYKIRDKISQSRKKLVGEISSDLERGDVKIEIKSHEDRKEFFRLLDDIYQGSDIRNRREQLNKIVESITPSDLASLILAEKKEDIVERSNITEDTAKKVLASASIEDIYKIECCPLQDELIVYLRKERGEDFTPLNNLSYGEKCTAIFSIALLVKEKPLLVDQPEDELDHAFIINNIVEHIRDLKERRQLIIATHNANIPVLGDAELILKVSKVPGSENCTVEERGGFEKESIIERLQSLEGGPEAFQKRREKYGI